MNDGNVSTSLWLIRLISVALLACVIVRGVPEGSALARTSIIVALALSGTWFLVEITIRRAGINLSGQGVAVLLPACACALAVGNSPGLFLSSLATAALFVLLLASIAALLSGPAGTAAPRLAIVLFCGAAGAAWQAAGAPLLATLLVRN